MMMMTIIIITITYTNSSNLFDAYDFENFTYISLFNLHRKSRW